MGQRKRILIIGGSGFVGCNLSRMLSVSHEVFATYRNLYTRVQGVQHLEFNGLADKDQCARLVENVKPDVIIYAAGSNDWARAEKDPNSTIAVHTNGANQMLVASDLIKSKFVLISSDCVFSGIDGNYSEGDTAIPLNSLGKAKLGAENYIRSRSLNHIIIRSAPLLGRGTLEHPSWLDQLRESEVRAQKITLSKNRVHNPIHIQELARMIEKVIENDIRNKTLHLGGLTKVSVLELANQFMERYGFDQADLEAMESILDSGPLDFSLNSSQTIRLLKTEPLLLKQSLDLL